MLSVLIDILIRDKVAKEPVEVAKPTVSCKGSNHYFSRAPIGKARLQHKCECGSYTMQAYQRRWDRR